MLVVITVVRFSRDCVGMRFFSIAYNCGSLKSTTDLSNSQKVLIINRMKRIQRKRIKGWKMPKNAKYVGRPTKWGNPFRLTPDGFIECYSTNRKLIHPWVMCGYSGGFETKDIVELYGKWLDGELKAIAPYLPTPPRLEELKGKDLACFCPLSSPCHVDVILERIGDNRKAKYTNLLFRNITKES